MQLKLAELADFCLADIYDFAQAQGREETKRIHEVIYKFGITDPIITEKITQHLQSKGCIAIADSHTGAIDVRITPFGVTTVESGGLTGLIPQYRQEPWVFLAPQPYLSR
jgi:hypothetical protein